MIDSLGLSEKDGKLLETVLEKEGISRPAVLRDHRKRGPVYWSLIFNAAKNAPEIFDLPPLKMINFKGIYIVDSDDYQQKLEQVSAKINSADAIESFSKDKARVSQQLSLLTKELKDTSFESLSAPKLHELITHFYNIRNSYTKYSFFLDTITRSVDLRLESILRVAGAQPSQKQLAYVPDSDTIEFIYLEKKKRFLRKHSEELSAISQKNPFSDSFSADLSQLMDEFADMDFVNFSAPLQSKDDFIKKILNCSGQKESISRLGLMKEKKEALLIEILLPAEEKGINPSFTEALFDFAGNLSAWESEARHAWTRLHRAAKPLIEEIGKRATQRNALPGKEKIFEKTITEIIGLSKA